MNTQKQKKDKSTVTISQPAPRERVVQYVHILTVKALNTFNNQN